MVVMKPNRKNRDAITIRVNRNFELLLFVICYELSFRIAGRRIIMWMKIIKKSDYRLKATGYRLKTIDYRPD